MPLVVDAYVPEGSQYPTSVRMHPIKPDGTIGEALPFPEELGGIVKVMIKKK
jgi:hypothetical protein